MGKKMGGKGAETKMSGRTAPYSKRATPDTLVRVQEGEEAIEC